MVASTEHAPRIGLSTPLHFSNKEQRSKANGVPVNVKDVKEVTSAFYACSTRTHEMIRDCAPAGRQPSAVPLYQTSFTYCLI